MEKDLESVLRDRLLDEQFPHVKSPKLLFNDEGKRNSCLSITPTNGALPTFGSSGLPNNKAGQLKESQGWFYCLPRFRQSQLPNTTLNKNFTRKTNLPANENFGKGSTPKQFLVFDQTGNKTTMMFSSEIAGPTKWTRKPTCFYNFEGELGITGNEHCSAPNLTDDCGSEMGSDMPEDSDEIDALLYSDEEDDYSDNGEETSTGHSPCFEETSTGHSPCFEEECSDEIDGSDGPIKRMEISESDYRIPSGTLTTSRSKLTGGSEYEEDAESSCAGYKPMEFTEMGFGNKRMKRKKIRETVSILQTILPGGKGKDAVMVLDEAINYLKTLKFRAESLNLSGCSD